MTYCSTVPSLCALEKRVHVADPALLPDQVMVEYEVPDDLEKHEITLADLPADWPDARPSPSGSATPGSRAHGILCWSCHP